MWLWRQDEKAFEKGSHTRQMRLHSHPASFGCFLSPMVVYQMRQANTHMHRVNLLEQSLHTGGDLPILFIVLSPSSRTT